jgi:hypothetical protein
MSWSVRFSTQGQVGVVITPVCERKMESLTISAIVMFESMALPKHIRIESTTMAQQSMNLHIMAKSLNCFSIGSKILTVNRKAQI